MIIDTHAHYDDGQFDTDRDELLNSMHEGGIGLIVNAGSTLESWGKIRKLTEAVEKLHGFEKIMEHLAPEAKHTFDEGLLKAADVYCIDVLSFTGKERKPKETGQSENV